MGHYFVWETTGYPTEYKTSMGKYQCELIFYEMYISCPHDQDNKVLKDMFGEEGRGVNITLW